MYDILTNPTGKSIWAKVLNSSDSKWKFNYTLPFQVCKESKLQWTQVRINYYILIMNTSITRLVGQTIPYVLVLPCPEFRVYTYKYPPK